MLSKRPPGLSTFVTAEICSREIAGRAFFIFLRQIGESSGRPALKTM